MLSLLPSLLPESVSDPELPLELPELSEPEEPDDDAAGVDVCAASLHDLVHASWLVLQDVWQSPSPLHPELHESCDSLQDE